MHLTKSRREKLSNSLQAGSRTGKRTHELVAWRENISGGNHLER